MSETGATSEDTEAKRIAGLRSRGFRIRYKRDYSSRLSLREQIAAAPDVETIVSLLAVIHASKTVSTGTVRKCQKAGKQRLRELIAAMTSVCCHAPLRVRGSGEGPHWYECTKCEQPTDPAPTSADACTVDTPAGA